MQKFDNIADPALARAKGVKFERGTPKHEWANVIRSFLSTVLPEDHEEGVSILSNRAAPTMANIGAVRRIAEKEDEFLQLLDFLLPRNIIWGDVPVEEEMKSGFDKLIYQKRPPSDVARTDLQQILGRRVPEYEIELLLGNPDIFLEIIQQEIPRLNLQFEGFAKGLGNLAKGTARLGGKAIKGSAKLGGKGIMGGAGRAVGLVKGAPGMTGRAVDRSWDTGSANYSGQGDPNALGSLINTISSKSGSSKSSPVEKHLANIDRKTSEQAPVVTPFAPDDDAIYIDSDGEQREVRIVKVNSSAGTATISDRSGGPQRYMPLDRLFRDELQEKNNLKMKKFNTILTKALHNTLTEAPEEELPPEEAPPPEGELPPEEAPMPVEPEEEMVPDDVDKLQVDLLELVRKALIINPNDIDRQAYAKLTTQVSFDNKDDLKGLLHKLVQNHYPDLELGGIETGPGV